MNKLICESCQNEFDEHSDEPNEIISFMVPFTKLELKIWKWQPLKTCWDCISNNDSTDEIGDAAYDAGFQAGGEEGYKAGLGERQ